MGNRLQTQGLLASVPWGAVTYSRRVQTCPWNAGVPLLRMAGSWVSYVFEEPVTISMNATLVSTPAVGLGNPWSSLATLVNSLCLD